MKRYFCVLNGLLLLLALGARAESALNIKLNFFGPAPKAKGGANVATSFYLKSLVQRNLQVKFTSENLLVELRKTFNAPDVELLASADLDWSSNGPSSVTQIVQMDGCNYVVVLTPLPKPGLVNFKVGVVEENDQKKIKNILLDTEIVLPDGEVAMLGFRDLREHSYFIALYVQGRDEEFGMGAVRPRGVRPKLLKKVNPVYPESALRDRIQGVVILEAVIDEKGKVVETRVVSPPSPLLDKAAIEAVRQWEYEPFRVKGKPQKALFTVTTTFRLADKPGDMWGEPDAIERLQSGDKRPQKIKHVNPVYPDEAKEKKIEGTVILEAVVDEGGKVSTLKTISSPDPLLTEAASKAVKQWEYEPFYKDGRCKKVVFTATVTFSLHED